MNFQDAKLVKQAAEQVCDKASEVLNSFPKGDMGLTPDAVKATAEWKKAYADFNASFARMRQVNSWFTKAFKKEIKAERMAKYAAYDAMSK